MKYDVIIIGAGPGGIFSAYELVQQNPDLKIAVFESGHPLEKRHCPIDGDKIKSCINCKSCSIMSGFGGAGAFSDGKYNITNAFGGTLYEYIGKSQAIDLMKYVDDINMKFGGEGTKLYSTAGTSFKKICMQNKLNLLDASVRHLGTDINFIVLENLYAELKDKVTFYFDAGGQVCGVDDGDFVGSFQFFCSQPHNVAGGGHTVGDGETDDLPAFFHKRLHDFHGLGQRRSRGLGRGLVFIGPPENFFRRNIHAIAVFILAQQNVQRQDGNVILFH